MTRWQEIREVRNQITHECRLVPAELIATPAIAVPMVAEMAAIIAGLRRR